MEIIKKVYDVKSLIQFRSVSKPWKSFIDSSDFIKGYGARRTQPHNHILSLSPGFCDELRYTFLVDDDNNETFKVQQQEFAPFAVSPLLKQYRITSVVGGCHGLLCLYCYNNDSNIKMLVIWNPSIRKSFGIVIPRSINPDDYGFGVCPVTKDPTLVKIIHRTGMPWHVEVFTLSSGVWNVIPSGNLPRQSITLDKRTHVVIDRFIYWGAYEKTFTDDGESTINGMVVSFDLITKEFKVVNLPDSLANELLFHISYSKLRGSLVAWGHIEVEGALCCGVWVMEHDSSFRKLFNIAASFYKILGFGKNGEPILEILKANEHHFTTLNVYDTCSQQIKNLGI
ncbi:probable galacturonosyltransferase 7 isoform X2 [Tanacetum coccineum]